MGLTTMLASVLLEPAEDLLSVSIRARLVLQFVLDAGFDLVACSASEVSP